MAALPYMQLYVADYLSDTMHLSAEEHGAYMLLIMNYWQTAKALPTQSERLARIARMTTERFEEIKPTLAEFFIEVDGHWHHKRIEADLERVEQKSNKARANAKAKVVQTLSERSANAEPTECYTETDTETDTEIKKTNKKNFGDATQRIWVELEAGAKKGVTRAMLEKKLTQLKPSPELLDAIVRALRAETRERQIHTSLGLWYREPCMITRWLKEERWTQEILTDEEIQAKARNNNANRQHRETDAQRKRREYDEQLRDVAAAYHAADDDP